MKPVTIGFFGLILILSVFLVLATLDSGFFKYWFYDHVYGSANLEAQSVGPSEMNVFENFDTGGYFGGSDFDFAYVSRYRVDAKTFYYALQNKGEKELCVKSKFFAFMTGHSTIRIAAGGTKAFKLADQRPPSEQTQVVGLYIGCGWFGYGNSITVVAPFH